MMEEFKGERAARNSIKPIRRWTLSIIRLFVFEELQWVIRPINIGVESCSPHSFEFAYTAKLTTVVRILMVGEFVVIKGESSQEVDKASSELDVANHWAVGHPKSLRRGDLS